MFIDEVFMKTIGLIGGMSFESTALYYQIINECIRKELGGLHSAKILLYSVNFAEIEECQASGNWTKSAQILSEVAVNLEKAGADCIVLCTNTMHKIADSIENAIEIPFIHIAKETAKEINKNNIKKISLLGTKYTMLEAFYKEKLEEFGIELVIPDDEDIEIINDIIYEELCQGIVKDSSREKYKEIIEKLSKKDIEGIVLACTEIGILLKQEDVNLPFFDTTFIHARQAALSSLK